MTRYIIYNLQKAEKVHPLLERNLPIQRGKTEQILKYDNCDLLMHDLMDNGSLESDKKWVRELKSFGEQIILPQRKSVINGVAVFSIENSMSFWRTEQMTSNSLRLKIHLLKSSLLENAISERLIITSEWYRESSSVQGRHLKWSGFQYFITIRTWTNKFIPLFLFLHSVKWGW